MTEQDVQIIRCIAFDATVALARSSLLREHLKDEDEYYGTAEFVLMLARIVGAEPQVEGASDARDELVDLASDLMGYGEMVRFVDRTQGGTGLGVAGYERATMACKEEIALLRDAADALRTSLAAHSEQRLTLDVKLLMAEEVQVFSRRSEASGATIPGAVADVVTARLGGDADVPDNDDAEPLDDVLARLNALVGVEDVKREVATAIALYRVQQEREARGLPTQSQSRHLVMVGPPGTGKTTVARLVAQAYRSLGSLRKGHIVECDRSDLVAEYLGQTGPRTNAKIDEALGGVLFIDEAYSLAGRDGDRYGDEAIAALLKRMEDDRADLVVIVAGYADEMATFLNSNPGLESRFGATLDFPSYGDADLRQIAQRMVPDMGYVAGPDVLDRLGALLAQQRDADPHSFGNAREVRRLLERATRRQAQRIATGDLGAVTDDDLTTLLPEDLDDA